MGYSRLKRRIQSDRFSSSSQSFSNDFENEGLEGMNDKMPAIEIDHPNDSYNQVIQSIYAKDSLLGKTFDRLNSHQRHAVFSEKNRIVLSAMVGSGKTTVLTAKIFYLHFSKGVPFDKMIVLTFTNKAAREIRTRIHNYLGDNSQALVEKMRFFGTFHGVARQILKEHPHFEDLGFKPDFKIMDQQEKQAFLSRLSTTHGLDIKYENKLEKRWQQYLQTGEVRYGNMKTEDDLKTLVTLAEEAKRSNNLLDFDDLITLCNLVQSKQNIVAPHWVIVDEFQDCNEEQLTMIDRFCDENTGLFVVGDPNQSIYAWRGSQDNIFPDFYQKTGATWMELPQNYRTTEKLLRSASCLLRGENNKLVATRDEGSRMRLVQHFDDQQEAYYYVNRIKALHENGGKWEEVAVLFRTRQQITLVHNILQQNNIPCQIIRKETLADIPVHFILYNLLKIGLNNNNIDACLALFTHSLFGTIKRNKTLIKRLATYEKEETTSLEQFRLLFVEKYPKAIRELKLIEKLQEFGKELKSENNTSLTDYFCFEEILNPTSIHYRDQLNEIKQAVHALEEYALHNGWGSKEKVLHAAIDQVTLEGSFQINTTVRAKTEGVHLLTIHASKGLEFRQVFVSGVNTGLLPLNRSKQGANHLKEEKRLLFVALTRAKDELELGWHVQPTMHLVQGEPSYFLNAIPEENIERISTPVIPKGEVNKEPVPEIDETDQWKVGMIVQHKKYGQGEITEIKDKKITCEFTTYGKKDFSAGFAPIQKV